MTNYQFNSKEAINGYSKMTNPWLRSYDASTIAKRDDRREKIGKTVSPWLDQLLETKGEQWA